MTILPGIRWLAVCLLTVVGFPAGQAGQVDVAGGNLFAETRYLVAASDLGDGMWLAGDRVAQVFENREIMPPAGVGATTFRMDQPTPDLPVHDEVASYLPPGVAETGLALLSVSPATIEDACLDTTELVIPADEGMGPLLAATMGASDGLSLTAAMGKRGIGELIHPLDKKALDRLVTARDIAIIGTSAFLACLLPYLVWEKNRRRATV